MSVAKELDVMLEGERCLSRKDFATTWQGHLEKGSTRDTLYQSVYDAVVSIFPHSLLRSPYPCPERIHRRVELLE